MPATPPAVKLGAIDLNLLVVFDAVMQERSVTVAGHTRMLDEPFFVLATQNPLEIDRKSVV